MMRKHLIFLWCFLVFLHGYCAEKTPVKPEKTYLLWQAENFSVSGWKISESIDASETKFISGTKKGAKASNSIIMVKEGRYGLWLRGRYDRNKLALYLNKKRIQIEPDSGKIFDWVFCGTHEIQRGKLVISIEKLDRNNTDFDCLLLTDDPDYAPCGDIISGGQSNALICKKIKPGEIKVDGKPDEPVWQDASSAIDFLDLANLKKSAKQTVVKTLWDGEKVYFSMICAEPQPEKIRADEPKIWKNDCCEVFIDTDIDRKTFYHLIVDVNGNPGYLALEPPKYYRNAEPLSIGIKAASSRKPDGWQIEISIPLKDIGLEGIKEGTTVGINFTREMERGTRHSSWAPLIGFNFIQPESFSLLRFEGEKAPSISVSNLGIIPAQKIQKDRELPINLRFNLEKGMLIWDKNRYQPLNDIDEKIISKRKLKKLLLKAAINEVASTGFVITNSWEQDREIVFSFSGLKGKNSSQKFAENKIRIREVKFFREATGNLIADPMPEIQKLFLPSGETREIWLQIDTSGIIADTYTGYLTIQAGKSKFNIPLEISVLPFELPKTNPLKLATWDYVPSPGRDKLIGGGENWKNYEKDLRDHGQNVFVIMSFNHPHPVYDKEGNLIKPLDFREFDKELAMREKDDIFIISTPRCFGNSVKDLEYPGPKWERMFTQWLVQLVAHLKDLGIGYENFALYPYDELHLDDDIKNAVIEFGMIKKIDPAVRIFLTTNSLDAAKATADFVDIWCPHINFGKYFSNPDTRKNMDLHLDFFRKTGKPVWSYENFGRGSSSSAYSVYRLRPWSAFRMGIQGYGFWAYNVWKGDPWTTEGKTSTQLITEAFSVVYSGVEPVPSIRWEGLREGMNDIKYISLLKEKIEYAKSRGMIEIAGEAEKLLENALKNVTEKRSDFNLADNYREKIAEMIVRLSRYQ